MSTPHVPDRRTVFQLAGVAGVDPRTAEKALTQGVEALHGRAARERMRRALAELGLTAPESTAA